MARSAPPPPQQEEEEEEYSSENTGSDEEGESEPTPATQIPHQSPKSPSTATAGDAAADSSEGSDEESSDPEIDAEAIQPRQVVPSPSDPPAADEEQDKPSEPLQKKKPMDQAGRKRQATESTPSGKSKKAKPEVEKTVPEEPKAGANKAKAGAENTKAVPEEPAPSPKAGANKAKASKKAVPDPSASSKSSAGKGRTRSRSSASIARNGAASPKNKKAKIQGDTKGRSSKKTTATDALAKSEKQGTHKMELDDIVTAKDTTATTDSQIGATLVRSNRGKSDTEKMGGDADSLGPKVDIDANVKSIRKGFDELQSLYPNLSSYVERIKAQHQCGQTLKRAFGFISDLKARTLESKIKVQIVAEAKTKIRRADSKKEVANLLIGLLD